MGTTGVGHDERAARPLWGSRFKSTQPKNAKRKKTTRRFFFQAEDGIRYYKVTEFRRVLFRSIFRATHPAPTGRVATGPTEGSHAGLLQPGPAWQKPFPDSRCLQRSFGIRGTPEGIPPAPGDLRDIPCTDRGTVCHRRPGPNPRHGRQLET